MASAFQPASLIPMIAVLFGMTLLNEAWVAILLYHSLALIWLIRSGPMPRRVETGSLPAPMAMSSVLVAALAGPAMFVLWPLLALPETGLAGWLETYGLTDWRWSVMVIYFALVHPPLEEAFWRRLTLNDANRPGIHDICFALYHVIVLHDLIQPFWLTAVFAILLGSSCFWRWAHRRSGRLTIPIATHMAADAGIIVAAYLLAR